MQTRTMMISMRFHATAGSRPTVDPCEARRRMDADLLDLDAKLGNFSAMRTVIALAWVGDCGGDKNHAGDTQKLHVFFPRHRVSVGDHREPGGIGSGRVSHEMVFLKVIPHDVPELREE